MKTDMSIEEIKEVVDLSLVESIKAKDKRIEELDKVNSLLQLRLASQEEALINKAWRIYNMPVCGSWTKESFTKAMMGE